MSGTSVHLTTHSPEATQALAAAFAELCRPNDVIGLQGTLGAGKTCFVKGLAAGLGVKDLGKVMSPTFVLLRCYSGRLTIYHFDAYRLQGAAEMEQLGCGETFESGGVSVIEWADHVAACLPAEHFMLAITVAGERDRDFRLTPSGPGAAGRLGEFDRALAAWRR